MTSENNENTKQVKVSRKTMYIAAAVFVVAAVIGAAAFLGVFEDLTDPAEVSENGEIVARVNGEEVTRAEFETILEQEKMQYEMQGMDLESEEMSDMLGELQQHVLDNYFVIPILLEQKAQEEGIEISEEEIEDRYQDYVAQFGGEEQLKEQMAAVDVTRDELDEDIIRELTIQNYIEQYLEEYLEENPEEQIDKESIELSEEEIEHRYQQLQEQYARLKEMIEEDDPDLPREQLEMQLLQIEEQYGEILEEENFEEIKPVLKEEMIEERAAREKQEKEQSILMAHIEELQEESEVETYF